ncbi:hydantoinase B/oxoprolinase family protein [Brevibacterium sp. 50QC2O2]|uniref:hydantoinase B/oxoprolinase family protein n=1 Tax=Brevibacterium sp. 50QC2O2 TaxID=2968459 RepID=UPI00211BD0E2|nr:hydantoinase B/oxoprolinase family protein [Brevibacterium sp. 50QC2O2]MCQ9388503.1 hydantoinase B/oxoprolinase family protein [Brevibacterium sp. 50QC2O2]
MTTNSTAQPADIDPIKVEVIGSALASVSEEMGEALVKASYSPNIKERRDCTTALFDAEGNALAQAEHIPMHLGSLMGIVKAVLDRYPVSDIRPGDGFLGNDPHTGGGTHLPDIVLVTPIFFAEELVGWATNLAHHSDYADRTHATIFQEGIRIPAVRAVRDWAYIDDVMHLILINMQVPAERIADFRAQLASNRLGVARTADLFEKYGTATMRAAGHALMDYTERKVRAGIREIKNGVYTFADKFDSEEIPDILDISLELTVKDEELEFVFDAPPQVRASINLVPTALLATVYYAVKTVVGSDIPTNAGLYRAISVTAPRGSVLSCVAPAAVNGRTQLCQRVVDLVHGALSKADPTLVTAASYGAVPATQFSGIDPRTGEYYVYLETIGGGLGASHCASGLNGVQAHITNTSNLPVESLEIEYPLTVDRYELVDDSAGVGEHPGGMGIHRLVTVNHDDCVCHVSISRQRTQPWGLEGGGPGRSLHVEVGDEEYLDQTEFAMNTGETIGIETAGGGGFGMPAKRPAELVERDLREGRISPATAEAAYGYVPAATSAAGKPGGDEKTGGTRD